MSNADIRKTIDSATTIVDSVSDPIEIALIARDASGDESTYTAIIAQIPPIKLGRTSYRVVSGGKYGLELVGPRGGVSSLVPNMNKPNLWAHIAMSGVRAKSAWYRREQDGTFTAI